jgi:hypothetical protein
MQDHQTALQPTTDLGDLPDTLAWRLHCPVCSAPEIERGQLDEDGSRPDEAGGDHTAVTVHPDRDAYSSPLGTRGGHVEIRLWCAAGHNFQLVIANHKGAEYVGVVV